MRASDTSTESGSRIRAVTRGFPVHSEVSDMFIRLPTPIATGMFVTRPCGPPSVCHPTMRSSHPGKQNPLKDPAAYAMCRRGKGC